MICGFFLVKEMLSLLGATVYGAWVVINSVIGWISTADLGVGNGMRNELAKAYALNDKDKEKSTIKGFMNSLMFISLIVFLLFIALTEIFIHTSIFDKSYRIPSYVAVFLGCLNLFWGSSHSIVLALQKSTWSSITRCVPNVIILLSYILISIIGYTPSLLVVSLLNGVPFLISNIVLIFIVNWKFELGVFGTDKDTANCQFRIIPTSVGFCLSFFLIQIFSVFINSTDIVIIKSLYSETVVTNYSNILKIYNSGSVLFTAFIYSFCSNVTYHFAQENYQWIGNRIKKLLAFCGLFSVGVLFVSINLNTIMRIWLKEESYCYDKACIAVFALCCIIQAFNAVYVHCLNGIGMIKMELFLGAVEAVGNIPLSVFFAKYLNMGMTGVKLATMLWTLLAMIVFMVLVHNVINKKGSTKNV